MPRPALGGKRIASITRRYGLLSRDAREWARGAVIPTSSWRPAERTAAEDVQVHVEDALPGVRPHVPDEAITALGDALLARDDVGRAQQGREQRAVLGLG